MAIGHPLACGVGGNRMFLYKVFNLRGGFSWWVEMFLWGLVLPVCHLTWGSADEKACGWHG